MIILYSDNLWCCGIESEKIVEFVVFIVGTERPFFPRKLLVAEQGLNHENHFIVRVSVDPIIGYCIVLIYTSWYR